MVQLRDWKRGAAASAVLVIRLLIGLIVALTYDGLSKRRSVNPSVEGPAAQGAGAYEVIDGDTIRAPYSVEYRLLNFDAPEAFQAPVRC